MDAEVSEIYWSSSDGTSCPIDKESKHIMWFSSLHSANQAIKDFETSILTKFNLYYRRIHDNRRKKKCIHWNAVECVPYQLVQTTVFECEHGKDRNKAYNEKRKAKKCSSIAEKLQGGANRKQYVRVKESKKKSCPAQLRLFEVMKFPECKVPKLDITTKRAINDALKEKLLSTPDDVIKESAWCVVFPHEAAHTGHIVKEVHPALSLNDVSEKQCRNIIQLENQWTEIAQCLRLSGPETRTTWESFRHEYNKLSGSQEQLETDAGKIALCKPTTEVEILVNLEPVKEKHVVNENLLPLTTSRHLRSVDDFTHHPLKRRHSEFRDEIIKHHDTIENEKDEELSFALSLVPRLKRLSSSRSSELRSKILQLFHEVEVYS